MECTPPMHDTHCAYRDDKNSGVPQPVVSTPCFCMIFCGEFNDHNQHFHDPMVRPHGSASFFAGNSITLVQYHHGGGRGIIPHQPPSHVQFQVVEIWSVLYFIICRGGSRQNFCEHFVFLCNPPYKVSIPPCLDPKFAKSRETSIFHE